MKYSIVNVKDVRIDNEIFRFDADYFNPSALKILAQIKKRRFFLIEDDFVVTKLAGFEYTKFFTLENMNSKNYYIALTSKNIQNEELNIQEFITIDKNIADIFLKRSKLIPDDVILSYTGEYRRALTLQNYDYQLGPNICLIRPRKNHTKSYYLSTFLNSKYGQLLLDKEKTLSAQPTVAMSRIRKIPVPEYGSNFYTLIEKIIKLKSQIIQNAEFMYKNSEKRLLKEINIENSALGLKSWSVKNYSDVKDANRLDAEYFQPKYDEIIKLIKNYSNGYDKLKNIVKIKDVNFIPEPREEYKYIELANIAKNGEINNCTVDFGENLPTRARRIVSTGDVVVSSIEGSLNSIALITNDNNNSLCSTGFYVINSNFINPETLFCLMKSEFIQMQLKRGCSGTILTAINKDEFENILLPKINSNIQVQIKENIQEMYKLKCQSKQLLEIAKRGVEIAIEQDEDIATNWINQELLNIGVESFNGGR